MEIWEAHRKAIESLYDGICSIYEYRSVRNEETKLTSNREVLVGEDIPCRLSFSSAPATDAGNVAVKQQETKLFLAPEVKVNPGSKILVTQNHVTEVYANSGNPAVYRSHQEIRLKLFERWA